MIVYGQRGSRYVLASYPQSSDYEGSIYSVEGNNDILVKVYENTHRTSDMENRVINAVNGGVALPGGQPVDVAYSQGRFVGFVFEHSWEQPKPEPAPIPPQPTQPQKRRNPQGAGAGTVIILVAIGLVLSAILFLDTFERLSMVIDPRCVTFNLRGIPMIVGGWIAMLLTLKASRSSGAMLTVILSVLAFLLGSVAVFGVICLLVFLVSGAASIVKAILPTLLTLAVVYWLVKFLIKGKF